MLGSKFTKSNLLQLANSDHESFVFNELQIEFWNHREIIDYQLCNEWVPLGIKKDRDLNKWLGVQMSPYKYFNISEFNIII